MTAHTQPGATLTTESAARIAEGVAAQTGNGGAVEAHPVVTPALVTTPETVIATAVPVAPAAAPATTVNVNVPKE